MRKEQRELLLVVVFASMAPKEEEMIMNETIHQGMVLQQQQQVDCRCCRRMAEVASSSVRRSTCRIVETFHCHESGSLFPRAPRKKMIAKRRRRDFFLFPFHSWNLCGVCLPLYWWITSTRIFCVNGVSVLWLAEKRIAAAFRGKSELISSTDNMHFLFNLNERLFDGLWNPGELKFQDRRKKKLAKYHDRPGNVFLITRLSGC